MIGFPSTHVKSMTGYLLSVTPALGWTETGGSLELAGQLAYLKMASSRFSEETLGVRKGREQ